MTHQHSYPGSVQQERLPALDEGYVIGMDIGGTNLRLALADPAGAILARCSVSTVGIRDAGRVVEIICERVDQLLQEQSVPRSSLLAIAAGAPGITNVDDGVVIATSYLMGWRDVPLRDLLEHAIGVPAAVDNDVNLAALGESWAGLAKGIRDFVFLAIGTGVGAGIVLNGQLFRGMGWGAGEIGNMLVPGTSEEPARTGEPGSLEAVVGGEGLRTQWQAQWSAEKTSLPQQLNATQIFDGATAGDSLAQSILERAARRLAYAIYNISLVLSCPLFVLGGSVGMHPALCDAVQIILQERGLRIRPRLTRSSLGPDAQLIGAVRLALDTAATGTSVLS
jgi:glucokinase